MVRGTLGTNEIAAVSDLARVVRGSKNTRLLLFRGQNVDAPLLPKLVKIAEASSITREQFNQAERCLNGFRKRACRSFAAVHQRIPGSGSQLLSTRASRPACSIGRPTLWRAYGSPCLRTDQTAECTVCFGSWTSRRRTRGHRLERRTSSTSSGRLCFNPFTLISASSRRPLVSLFTGTLHLASLCPWSG
jgi:hypothetical protein